MTPLYIIAVISVLLAFLRVRHVQNLSRLRALFLAALAEAYVSAKPMPSLALRFHYSFPALTIAFPNKEQRDEAQALGLNDAFLDKVQVICASYGSSSNPFDARRAVFFTYPTHINELLAKSGLM